MVLIISLNCICRSQKYGASCLVSFEVHNSASHTLQNGADCMLGKYCSLPLPIYMLATKSCHLIIPSFSSYTPILLLKAFVMSVFWISITAWELLNCLAALLGLMVLEWGNLMGDLIADVAVAKISLPAMAMAGCFVGFGTALFIQTSNVHPNAYELHFHVGIVIKFVFLLLSLIGSLLGITWCRFQVPRFWRFCCVGLYILFTAVSLVISKFSV